MIPEILKNFNLFVDGRGHAGKCPEVTPPKLTLKADDYRAGGMDAAIKLEMGMEALELSYTLVGLDPENLKLYGLTQGAVVPMTLRGAMEDSEGAVIPVVINVRGQVTELDMGTWKAGEKAELKVTVACRYYKLTHNQTVLHEIDIENMVRMIGGVDQLAAQRAAIGL